MKNKITLTCVLGIDPELFDLNLIYHFINHYRKIGIDNFSIAVNATSENKTSEGIKILKECGVKPVVWIGTFIESEKMIKLHNLQESVNTEWILAVDSDEFVRTDSATLDDTLTKCNSIGYMSCRGQLIDRFSSNNKLKSVSKEINIFEQFPVEDSIIKIYNSFNKNVPGFYRALDNKCFLFKTGNFKSGQGQHYLYYKYAANVTSMNNRLEEKYFHPTLFKIDHFKWTETYIKRFNKRIKDFSKDPNCSWNNEIIWIYGYIMKRFICNNKKIV